MRVVKRLQWDAAHFLSLPYASKCSNLHGHTYFIEIEVEGPVNSDGMVMDFVQLKQAIAPASFDHQQINGIEWFKSQGLNPTAENCVLFIKDVLDRNWLPHWPFISRIRVYETPDSYAEQTWGPKV